ncbi:MAG: hypothetical protein GWP15_04175 [Nitrospirae bacterium]|nr:hypothetical protein [Nitrospirota bacterium]
MTNIKKQFVNEQRFIQRVDAALPENSMIFQLPYMVFPEGGKRAQFGDYDHFKAALHSRRQRWSFGSMKGREVAVWQQAVSALPVEKMVEELVFMGFRGIYLCRSAYRDHAKEIEALLTLAIDSPPMLSESNNELFWNLEPYVAHLKSSQTDVEWNQNTQRVQQQIEWTKRIKSGKQ